MHLPPERWQRMRELFGDALERSPEHRGPFLAEACGGDTALERDLQSLLEAHAGGQEFLESPPGLRETGAQETAPPEVLPEGSRLGPYEVLGLLGAGGMGEVYRARDTRLGREVAVKVLPAHLSDDSAHLRLFEREARAASALNHPNIVTLHDIGNVDSRPFLIMELVAGRTLREMLRSGRLPVADMLSIANQLARGLAEAHAAGIVHRDLKPENVMVTAEGVVKILDFGVAKLEDIAQREAGRGLDSAAPASATRTGLMGTLGYMSPEQARREAVDFRSDQFSFGAMLYEMAQGRPVFAAARPEDTLEAILHRPPEPLRGLDARVPHPLRSIIERCLAKDRDDRYSSTRELARELERLRERAPSAARRAALRAALWTLALGTAAGLLWLGAGARGRKPAAAAPPHPPPSVPARIQEPLNLTRHVAADADPKWSPDGSRILFSTEREAGVSRLYVMTADGTNPTRLGAHPAAHGSGIWSPDGLKIAFVSDREGGGIFVMEASGEQVRKLYPKPAGGLAWSPDGQRVAFTRFPFGVYAMSADGRDPKLVAQDADNPAWSPDGTRLAFDSAGSVFVANAGGSQRQRLTRSGHASQPAWSPNGESIAFTSNRDGNNEIYAMSSDGSGVVRVTSNAANDGRPAWSPDGSRLAFTSDREGNSDIYVMSVPPLNPRRLTDNVVEDMLPAWSPDGKEIAFVSNRDGKPEIYAMDADGGNVRRLTSNGSDDQFPSVSPDGRTIAFVREQQGRWAIYSMNRDGTGEARLASASSGRPAWSPDGKRLAATEPRGVFFMGKDGGGATLAHFTKPRDDQPAWSPDGTQVLFRSHRDGHAELYLANVDGSRLRRLTRIAAYKSSAAWSPDGARIAFVSEHDGPASPVSQEIYVMNADGTGLRRLTHNQRLDTWPAWSPDGKTIAFHSTRDGTREIYVLTLE